LKQLNEDHVLNLAFLSQRFPNNAAAHLLYRYADCTSSRVKECNLVHGRKSLYIKNQSDTPE
jgi:hypothetical protein